MVVIQLGEDVRSVRQKIGMDANDYLFLWRSINLLNVLWLIKRAAFPSRSKNLKLLIKIPLIYKSSP